MTSKLIKSKKIIVGDGRTIQDSSILLENGIIKEIGAGLQPSAETEVYDFSDKVLMPGIIDAHTHIQWTGDPSLRPTSGESNEYRSLRGLRNVREALKNGITTIADLASRGQTVFAIRNAIQEGIWTGPRVLLSGRMITATGGRSINGQAHGSTLEVDGPMEARKAARNLLSHEEVDILKLAASQSFGKKNANSSLQGHKSDLPEPQLNVEEMKAITEEAKKLGVPVHSHAHSQGVANSLEAGVDVIIHGQKLDDSCITHMSENGIPLVPTLSCYRSTDHYHDNMNCAPDDRLLFWDPSRSWSRDVFEQAIEADIPIVMGSDSGVPYSYFGENIYEMVYMVDFGLEEAKAIKAGTQNAAKALSIDDEVGTIETGKYADIIVLNDDPEKNIEVLVDSDEIKHVLLNGEIVEGIC